MAGCSASKADEQPMQDNKNTLYYGDNLFILREHIPNESVDLIYLDPPFNSNRNYNVLFKDEHGTDSEAQIKAFEDTWHWNLEAEQTYAEILTDAPNNVAKLIDSMRDFIGTNQVMAYLVMMTTRLVELHRVLKPTGSLYLHCDPTASHYLKVILDIIFGAKNFKNEIIWKRNYTKKGSQYEMNKFANNIDVLLFYGKSEKAIFKTPKIQLPREEIERKYDKLDENGRRFKSEPIELPRMMARSNLIFEFMGYTPKYGWMMTKEKLEQLRIENKIYFTKNDLPRRKNFMDDYKGTEIDNIWTDISPLGQVQSESLGYPTQKPIALLERIIQASSEDGDIVLDPFCGCGTAVVAAEKLKRKWIGIDITHLGITAMKFRLKEAFPGISFRVVGEPTDIGAARQLSNDDRYQFQWWALSLIPGAMPLGGHEGGREGKKGSDKGIDGVLTFIDDQSGKAKRALIQVKSGHVNSSMIRDLVGTVQREQATFGIFVTLDTPSKDMVVEGLTAGFYNSPGWKKKYPIIQIYTIEDLLNKAEVNMPPRYWWGKKAKILKSYGEQKTLDLMPRVKHTAR